MFWLWSVRGRESNHEVCHHLQDSSLQNPRLSGPEQKQGWHGLVSGNLTLLVLRGGLNEYGHHYAGEMLMYLFCIYLYINKKEYYKNERRKTNIYIYIYMYIINYN